MDHVIFELSFTPAAIQKHCDAVQKTVSSLQGQAAITTTWKCEAQAGVCDNYYVEMRSSSRCMQQTAGVYHKRPV